ncbi:MAG TPA: response regulator, partial [Phycisphaerae bacterium]|nr:response regulator [Phycisphaerae bacterium]
GLKLMDKPRALIVDEDPDLLQLIARSLEETGRFETRVAESAFEAGAVVSEFHPQTIVTDVDIPGISGRVLTRWLAARAETRDTVLVGMSASMTETDRQALLQEGFAETIAKPFSIRQLLAVLDNVVAVTA